MARLHSAGNHGIFIFQNFERVINTKHINLGTPLIKASDLFLSWKRSVGFLKQLLSFSLHNSTGRRHVLEWNEKGKLV